VQIARYFAVGAAAATVDLGLFTVMVTGLGAHYLAGGAAAFLVATVVNYLLCIRFVFTSRSRFSRRGELIAVYFVSGSGLVVHQAILYAGVDLLRQSVYASKLAAMAVVFFWNYLLRKHYVFVSVPGRD